MSTKTKKRMTAAMLVGVMVVTTLTTGCGQKSVDYSLEDNQENGNSGSNSAGDSGGLAGRLGIPESCDVELDVGNSGLNKISIEDDEISVPATDQMSVSYYTAVSIDNSYKQQIAETLFDKESGIYEYDYENKIKSDIEEEIARAEEERDNYIANGDTLNAEWYDDYIKELETQLQDAPEEYEAAGDYSGDYFIGTYDGKEYMFSIFKADSLSAYAYFTYNGNPLEYRPYEGATGGYFYWDFLPEDKDIDINNACQITQEDAIQQADDFLAEIGITDMMQTSVTALQWYYYDQSTGEDIASEYDGYVVNYTRGIDGASTYAGNVGNVDNLMQEDGYVEIPVETCAISVDDNGILEATWSVKLEATGEVDKNVELLSWDEILEKANTNVAEYYTEYPALYKEIEYNDVRLTYYLAVDDSKEGSYMYVPVWVFSEYDEYIDSDVSKYPNQLVIINAVDGTVVDLLTLSKELETYEEYIY